MWIRLDEEDRKLVLQIAAGRATKGDSILIAIESAALEIADLLAEATRGMAATPEDWQSVRASSREIAEFRGDAENRLATAHDWMGVPPRSRFEHSEQFKPRLVLRDSEDRPHVVLDLPHRQQSLDRLRDLRNDAVAYAGGLTDAVIWVRLDVRQG